jgi:hypothetical protein
MTPQAVVSPIIDLRQLRATDAFSLFPVMTGTWASTVPYIL